MNLLTTRNVTTIFNDVHLTLDNGVILTHACSAGFKCRQREAHRLTGPLASLGNQIIRVQVGHVNIEFHIVLVA